MSVGRGGQKSYEKSDASLAVNKVCIVSVHFVLNTALFVRHTCNFLS